MKKSILSIFNTINKHDDYGLTRLYRAARHGDKALVRSLLKKGADPNLKTGCGFSPLHIAAFWGEYDVVRLLLGAGADPNAVNDTGWTPLHSASVTAGLEGRRRVIELLLQHKANAAAEDSHGWTPHHYAALWQDPDNPRLKLILQHLKNDKTEMTGHQPDLDKLGLRKSPEEDRKTPKPPKTPPPPNGQIPRHH